MAQVFDHQEGNAKGASNLVDQAHGVINMQIRNIELAVNQLRTRGWEGEAASKFYAVASEMVDGARRLQDKMAEMRDDLATVNRSFADANASMGESVNAIKYDITRTG
ncbi:WXG100 family type VII secretion target [Plantactinospora endophytica]|uniref:ESAT-6-like protein n=1 Tax=Plantactinospora endophytica TaxID=673535 RepID=A0ABQ4E185_9ACTN|nr:WXG100 family type VII secretion target [Plantactinospora endophytica]GIG88463.1 hypothetical protein Pen02_33990 [Plantactinospora endophytica]